MPTSTHNIIKTITDWDGNPEWLLYVGREPGGRAKYELVARAEYHRGHGYNVEVETAGGHRRQIARFKKYMNTKAQIKKRMVEEVTEFLTKTPEEKWSRANAWYYFCRGRYNVTTGPAPSEGVYR